MPILQNLRNSIARAIGTKNLYYDAFLSMVGGGYTSYDYRGHTYIERGYAYNPDVYAIIKQQSDKHASIPWTVKKVRDVSAKKRLEALKMSTKGILTPQQRFAKKVLETKAFEEREMDFPLEMPNPIQTWHEFKELEKVYLKTTGNIFYYKVFPEDGLNKGVPKQIYILPSHLIQIVLKDKPSFLSDESPIDYYMLIEGQQFVRFEAENVFQVKYANPIFDYSGSHLYGLSPLRSALRNIQSSNVAIDNNIKTLSNSGAFGFLHSKGQNVWTAEQAKEVKSRIREMDDDPTRLSKIAGVSAEIGFTRISLTTDELKPFDYLKNDQKVLCNVLGWSDKLLNNDEGAKYDNANIYRKQVITDNIMPDNDLINKAFQEHVLSYYNGYGDTVLESSYDELPEMQEDMAKMMEWVDKAINIGLISRAEGRKIIRMPESDDTDLSIFTVTQDVIPLSEAIDENFRLNPQNTDP